MANYRVKSNNPIMVLKRKDLALKDLQSKLKKDEKLEDRFPEALIQGDWVNVTAVHDQSLNDQDYEPRRLYQLYINGFLDLVDGKVTPPAKRDEEVLVEMEVNQIANKKIQ